jgi:hypothetical protein
MENKAPKPLTDILAEKGKSQRWLAVQCGLVDSTVARWVSGKVVPGMIARNHVERIVGHPVQWGAK